MVKKIEKEEEPVDQPLVSNKVVGVKPELNTKVQDKANQISALFSEIMDIEGEKFDASNPDHVIIAAYLVGLRGVLRR